MNPNKFTVGDRVVVTKRYNSHTGEEGAVTDVTAHFVYATLDSGQRVNYYPESLSHISAKASPCDEPLKKGDRAVVKVNKSDYGIRANVGRKGEEVTIQYVSNNGRAADVRFDDGKQASYMLSELTRVFVPVDERAELVKAAEEATLKRADRLHQQNEAQRAYARAEIAVFDAQRAIREYDEAHREPTFPEKLRGLGIGAVVKGTRVSFVKTADDTFVSSETGNTYGSESFLHGSKYTILSEGVKA